MDLEKFDTTLDRDMKALIPLILAAQAVVRPECRSYHALESLEEDEEFVELQDVAKVEHRKETPFRAEGRELKMLASPWSPPSWMKNLAFNPAAESWTERMQKEL